MAQDILRTRNGRGRRSGQAVVPIRQARASRPLRRRHYRSGAHGGDRHSAVRAFGLAGKVVIIDEIHSYDTYTGTIVDKLVTLLRDLHCTVIILSATLTQSRRAAFLGAHQPVRTDYPLITAVDSQSDRPGPRRKRKSRKWVLSSTE